MVPENKTELLLNLNANNNAYVSALVNKGNKVPDDESYDFYFDNADNIEAISAD
jgi:hypothetical protein